jgi:RimJ/RimL family protein N-acetyltransferase
MSGTATRDRVCLVWAGDAGVLEAREPALADVERHARELAAGYNAPDNAALMGHAEPISEAEVVETYAAMIAAGGRAFLLFRDGAFVGDADLRGLRGGAAEFAFMIGARAAQGKGLGTRFARMVHAFGFTRLGLDRIYASIVPHNTASRRVFDKLGYVVDDGPAARAYADEPDDLVLALARETFVAGHADLLAQLRVEPWS